jgi:AraC-like DNA-binding protein
MCRDTQQREVVNLASIGSSGQRAAAILLRPLAQLLQKQGVDAQALFAKHGIAIADTGNPDAHIDVAASTALLTDAVEVLGDPSLGINMARHAEYSSFGGLGLAIAAGGSMRSVLQRIIRFHRLISDVVLAEFSEDERYVAIHFSANGEHAPHPQAILLVMASIVRLLRIRIDAKLNPVKVQAPEVNDAFHHAMSRYFRVPVEIAPRFSLYFERAAATVQLQASDSQLAAMLDATLNQRLAAIEKGSLAVQLSLWIEQRLPEGEPPLAEAASEFCLSTRSLQRRLAEEQLSWKKLIENTRKTLVERHLRIPGMSVTQLAFLLGFADVSSFSRAFKKWYGMTPTQFR